MTYNVQLSVIVRGSGLWGSNFEFVKKEGRHETQYTPLGGSSGSPLYILTDNGVYRIYANGKLFRTITIEGMVIPEQPYSRITGQIRLPDNTRINERTSRTRCLNYPFRLTESGSLFYVSLTPASGVTWNLDEVTAVNCSNFTKRLYSSNLQVSFRPTDPSLPSWVAYQGVIYFVANYDEQQRKRR